MPYKGSGITCTDQFCGAGGSSLGATACGAEVVLALNHWELAIETHNTNFPKTTHICTDVQACDPRRFPSTHILITSPECTNHSLAKGKKRPHYKKDLFGNLLIDPAEERSRATMWDVPRFAEYHAYDIIITENVVDVRNWVMWYAWLEAMHALGYEHECVYFNSMFAHPTPQSRDRIYIVFWKAGNRKPNLMITPPAWCSRCEHDVAAVQTWKNPARQYGRYGSRHGQYIYTCPECRIEVKPYYYPAFTAIDWSLPIERIGDRRQPLKPRTIDRVKMGLERFKGQYLLMDNVYYGANGSYTKPVTDAMRTQTARQSLALVVQTKYSHAVNNRSSPVTDAMPTQPGQSSLALVASPYLVKLCENSTVIGLEEPMHTQVNATQHYLVQPTPFIVEAHGTSDVRPIDGPLGAVLAGGNHHYLAMPLIQPLTRQDEAYPIDKPLRTQTNTEDQALLMPFIASYYGTDTLRPVTEAMGTQSGHDHHAVVTPIPFIASQYNGPFRNPVHAVDEPMMTVPGMAVHSLAQPSEPSSVEDCGFRMLEPHEIQHAMAFPESYIVKGTKRERVKQLGNAVTPPVMQLLVERAIASLEAA